MKQKFCFSMGQIQLGSLSYHVWSNFSQTPMKGSSLPYSRHVTKVNNFPGITPHLTSFLHTLFESQFTQLGMQLIKLAQLCSLPWLANVTSFISDISVAKLQSTSLSHLCRKLCCASGGEPQGRQEEDIKGEV